MHNLNFAYIAEFFIDNSFLYMRKCLQSIVIR